MTITCTRKLRFDAAHRVLGHEGQCANLHGHGYTVELTAQAESGLDTLGRVVDFAVLKEKVGSWVDQHWDHTAIIYAEDQGLLELAQKTQATKKPFILPDNPTAENLARYLLETVCPVALKATGVQVVRVRVHETPNCYADAFLN